jgi:hypothetical protein
MSSFGRTHSLKRQRETLPHKNEFLLELKTQTLLIQISLSRSTDGESLTSARCCRNTATLCQPILVFHVDNSANEARSGPISLQVDLLRMISEEISSTLSFQP